MSLSAYRVDYDLLAGGPWRCCPKGIAAGPRITRGQYLYVFTLFDKYHKVGISKHPDWRRRELQCGTPVEIEVGAVFDMSEQGVNAADLEREVHALLAHDQVSGEWFECEEHIIGRAIKEAFVKLYCPPLYRRWQRFRLHCTATSFQSKVSSEARARAKYEELKARFEGKADEKL